MYAIMEEQIGEFGEEYDDEFRVELDRRYTDYVNSKTNIISAEESRKRVAEILKGGSR
jgi:hypothetical protein